MIANEPTRPQQDPAAVPASGLPAGQGDALPRYFRNLRDLPWDFLRSLVRHGRPTSDRARSQAVFTNLFLHILPTRMHRYSLRIRATLGLGVISLVLFALLVATGIPLMIYYKPSVDQAYDSMKEIQYIVPTGRFVRNIHRWSAHAMVACVMLHMARAFYTAAYKGHRKFNWVVGMILFVLTLALSFTGYLLPWDQLAYWAVTIGSEIAQSPREVTDALGVTAWCDIGGFQKQLILGANHVGQEALIRFYLLHVMVLPLLLSVFLAVHFWRIRKDGGITRPASADAPEPSPASAAGAAALVGRVGAAATRPSRTYGLMAVVRGKTAAVDRQLLNTVPTWPHALYAIAALAMTTLAVMLALGFFFDAPLKELANPAVPENPAKAPWYFLGLQELVSYSAFMGGVAIPAVVVLGLMCVPYLDREAEDTGVWFSGRRGWRITWQTALFATAVVIGMMAFTVNRGWLRSWYPELPQIVITFVNPGTVMLVLFTAWSLAVTRWTNSTRLGALAVFTCFVVAFLILTYFATVHRGPNWGFYWSQEDWPVH
ncbi:MAG: cytochrome b N-terminal domain-containing protein [Planctomycetales bacterium]